MRFPGLLANGTHMLKVVLRSDKNPASSNTYFGLDNLVTNSGTYSNIAGVGLPRFRGPT